MSSVRKVTLSLRAYHLDTNNDLSGELSITLYQTMYRELELVILVPPRLDHGPGHTSGHRLKINIDIPLFIFDLSILTYKCR